MKKSAVLVFNLPRLFQIWYYFICYEQTRNKKILVKSCRFSLFKVKSFYMATLSSEKYKSLADNNLCAHQCGRPRGETRLCEICREKNKARTKERRKERAKSGVCLCGKDLDGDFANCSDCRKYNAEYRHSFRRQVLEIYGGKCVCCGETEEAFLAFDHINNDGGNFRKRRRGGDSTLRWLKANNYPKDIQILCHNCNWAKHSRGICPHQSL